MGQDKSKSYTPPAPLTFLDCLVDGRIDLPKYCLYSKRHHDDEYIDINKLLNHKKRKNRANGVSSKKQRRIHRLVKRHPIKLRCLMNKLL